MKTTTLHEILREYLDYVGPQTLITNCGDLFGHPCTATAREIITGLIDVLDDTDDHTLEICNQELRSQYGTELAPIEEN